MKKIYLPVMALLLVTSLGFAAQAHAEDTVNTQINAGAKVGGMMGAPHMRFGGEGNQGSEDGKGHGGVYGTVTAVNSTGLTVTNKQTGTVYAVDSTNAKIDKSRTAITLSGITVGDTVFVEGTVNGTAVVATAIHDGVMLKGGMPGGNPMPGVSGTVTSVSGNTITVSSKKWTPGSATSTPTTVTYTIDATNASIQKNGVLSSVTSIAVGDMIGVQGTVSGTSVVATKINDGKMMRTEGGDTTFPDGNGQPIIGGTVTSVSGSTVTIKNKSNVAYTIDVSAAKITKNDTAGTASSVAVGDTVLAQGTVNGTSVVAVTVIDQGQIQGSTGGNPAPKGFFGKIGSFFSHLFGF